MRTGVQTSSSSSVRSGLQPCPLYLIITCHQEYLHFFRQIYFLFLATVPTVSYYHLHSIASSRIFLPFFVDIFPLGQLKVFSSPTASQTLYCWDRGIVDGYISWRAIKVFFNGHFFQNFFVGPRSKLQSLRPRSLQFIDIDVWLNWPMSDPTATSLPVSSSSWSTKCRIWKC